MNGHLRYFTAAASCAILICCQHAWAAGSDNASDGGDRAKLIVDAISPNRGNSDRAITQLRNQGPAGLAALMNAYQKDIDAHAANPTAQTDSERWRGISRALDAVAKQRDAWATGLYWYTDLEAAEAAARESGKPIVSLHLLGQLDQELSCANSRFFRVTLYPNHDVQTLLRTNFILHWKSERPVPLITIDFGDGRKIVRTITGNSIHYILDADGRVIDAIPGLYGAEHFVRRLNDAQRIELSLRDCKSAAQRVTALRDWHLQQIRDLDAACQADLLALNLTAVPSSDDFAAWSAIGKLHEKEMKVDHGVQAVMLEKNPDALRAGRLAIPKMDVEAPLARAVRNIQTSIAQDCMRNDYLLHRQIHQWLADGEANTGLDAFDNTVYTKLFLTPPSDPWLGLAPADAYSALDHDGLETVAAKP